MTTQDLFLSLCVKKAWDFQGLTLPNPAVGALVLDENYNILALQAHQKAGFPHAEVLALLEAFNNLTGKNIALQDSASIHQFLLANHNGLFYDKTMFITLEPCSHYGKTPPCAKLLSELKPKEIFIGTRDTWGESANGAQILIENGIKVHFMESKLPQLQNNLQTKKPKILESGNLDSNFNLGFRESQALDYGLVESSAFRDLLLPFLCLKNKGRFNLFKLAIRLNGDYKSGQISCKQAQIFTHNQRTIADSIIISGKTLLNDKPTLDSRFADEMFATSKMPDIQILTRSKNSINKALDAPLFNVPNRQIHIASAPQELWLDSGYNIIEGGLGLFNTLQNHIDMLLFHISPTFANNLTQDSMQDLIKPHTNAINAIATLKSLIDFKVLHIAQCGKDVLLWLKPNF